MRIAERIPLVPTSWLISPRVAHFRHCLSNNQNRKELELWLRRPPTTTTTRTLYVRTYMKLSKYNQNETCNCDRNKKGGGVESNGKSFVRSFSDPTAQKLNVDFLVIILTFLF